MRTIIIKLLVIFSIISFYGQISAQTEHNLHYGDKVKYMGKKYKWEPDSPFNYIRAFASFGDDLTSVSYIDHKLYFLKYDKKEDKYIETTQIADIHNSYFRDKPLMFEYANMYFVVAYSVSVNGHKTLRIYKCADNNYINWVAFPHYYTFDMPNNKLKKYDAAYIFGGKIYLAYNSYYEYNSSEGNVDYIRSFGEKKIYIDECIIDNGKFKVDTTYLFHDAISKDRFVIKTMDGFKHRDGNQRLIVSYYVESIHYGNTAFSDNTNMGGGVTILDIKTGQHHTLFKNDEYICAIDAIQGSLKGKKISDYHTEKTFRLQVVYNHFEKHTILRWKNKGHFYYRTFTYGNGGYKELYHGKIINHEKALPTSNYKMNLQLVPRYIPSNIMDNNRNNDIIKKEIWLLHPGKHGGLWANIFYSDRFKPDPATYTYSTDLMDDKKYGSGVRNLWTLIGVTEGAPPVSMDWVQWNLPPRPSGAHPSTLIFSSTSKSETKITSTFSRSWYNEIGAKVGNEKTGVSGGASFRYTNAYNKSETEDLTNELKISENYYSSEDTQDTAYLIWQIPNIYRIKYATYPWWDEDLTLSLDSSTAFLFYSLSNTLFFEEVSKTIKPFTIQNPNDSTFYDWKITNPYRDTIEAVAGSYSIPPHSISWANNAPGVSNTFVNSTTKTTTTSQKNSFSWTGNVNYSIPKVFQVNTTHNFTFAYETDVSLSTSISKAVTISMKKLENKEKDGAQMSSIYTDAYFFKPIRDKDGNLVDWWYYKYFKGHHPWYVTYVVNSSSKIAVKTPKDNGLLQETNDFSWTHDTKDEFKYTVLFCKDDYFGPVNSIEMPVGENFQLEITDEILNQFPSDSIVYWVVKGKDSQNHYTWSNIHWFVVPKKTIFNQATASGDMKILDFLVYPNPVSGNYVNVAFESNLDNNWVNIEWMALNGKIVYSQEKQDVITDGCLFKVNVPILKPGIYFLKISTPSSSGVGKVVITK